VIGNYGMRILYLTPWFEPEPMIKGLPFTKALAQRGHDVEVVTGFPNYPKGKLYPGYRIALHKREVTDGIIVHRVAHYPSHDRSSVGRVLNYVTFFVSALTFSLLNARRFDVIYTYPPITVSVAAAIAGRAAGKPFVMDIFDFNQRVARRVIHANLWLHLFPDGFGGCEGMITIPHREQ